MRITLIAILSLITSLASPVLLAADNDADKPDQDKSGTKAPFKAEAVKTSGTVKVEGKRVEYNAEAGTLVVHPDDWSDVPTNNETPKDKPLPQASMFYVAYFKQGAKAESRPVTFIYNGGPGSATMWLHMGAFGPVRVVTADDTHTPAAPYNIVNNDYSLLDASDLVFIDAPGAGFSRVTGKDSDKAFYGVDQDASAFANFIVQFLSKYGRWNSPKYLFGESYGTTRSAALAHILQSRDNIDLNGVILLSQILTYSASPDGPEWDPGNDVPYEVALPTYTATAWYHHKLPNQDDDLEGLLARVEKFALGDYAAALAAGGKLPAAQKQAIAEQLHAFTGLSVDYLLKADLRISGGVFEKQLLSDTDMTTGRLDTRFSGTSLDPLGKEAQYDPQSSALSSAYTAALNDYMRKTLNYGKDKRYLPSARVYSKWDFKHQPPGAWRALVQAPNVLPDLADAMKRNPNLRVMLNAGYYDLATPFFQGVYEMHHLPMPAKLQDNIEYKFYKSGHMVYAHEPSLKALHDNVANFIESTGHK